MTYRPNDLMTTDRGLNYPLGGSQTEQMKSK